VTNDNTQGSNLSAQHSDCIAGFLAFKKELFEEAEGYLVAAYKNYRKLGTYFSKYGISATMSLPITGLSACLPVPSGRQTGNAQAGEVSAHVGPDVREFLKRLNYIIEERGYVLHIDDGILLNMAPLWELIASWQKEPKKAWEALERGDYDWAYQAMDHWPERVREKCKTNKSCAIAHGLA